MTAIGDIQLSEGAFFGLGHPILDISTEVPPEFLQRYGLQANNVVLAEKVFRYNEISNEVLTEGNKYSPSYSPGGSAQNTLKTIAWLLERDDLIISMGCIGSDQCGTKLEQQMSHCRYQKTSDYSTGTCLILITDQARSMITNLGAANQFTIEYLLRPENWSAVERAQIFYVPAYFLRTCSDAVGRLAQHAAEARKIFAFNLSAEFVCQNFGEQIMDLLPSVDYLFGNEQEARCFAQHHLKIDNDTDIVLVTKELQKLLTKNVDASVIITRGADSIIFASGHRLQVFHVHRPSTIADTIGCGDAFVGGFLAYRSLNRSVDDCINAACYCAYECLLQTGCQFPHRSSFEPSQRYCHV